MSAPVYLAGSGTYLPGPPIPFAQAGEVLGALPDAPAKVRRWLERTTPLMAELLDIEVVHYALDPKTRTFSDDNVTMAVKAARAALELSGIEAEEVDLICYGSAHQDQMPTASVRIQEALGIERCDELSIHANCTSAYKALYLAQRLIEAGRNRTALVLSANVSSSELCAEYYNQPLLDRESLFLRWFLCDGAGAALLSADPARSAGFRLEASFIESIGGKRPSLMFNGRPAYWLNPRQEFEQGRHHLRQNFRGALSGKLFAEGDGSVFFKGLQRMAAREGIPLDQVKRLQINMPTRHVVEAIMDECATVGIGREALFTRLDRLGYCGPPMALIGLDCIVREERQALGPGERVVSFVTEVSKFMQAGYSLLREGR